ncbi:MAG TPA: zinc ribbon domain-containing protein [Steroidobacteraceae bacterium]|jgi:uncharacterized OB-fold protein
MSGDLPPAARSTAFEGLTAAAARGRLELQSCKRCQAVQYPPREACHRCLSTQLHWMPQSGGGVLIAQTTVFHSYESFFGSRGTWRVGLIQLECGPIVMAHVHAAVAPAPARVRVIARLDRSEQGVLIAIAEEAPVSVLAGTSLAEILLPART